MTTVFGLGFLSGLMIPLGIVLGLAQMAAEKKAWGFYLFVIGVILLFAVGAILPAMS